MEGHPEAYSQGGPENAWILAAAWRFVNERVSTRRDPTRDQALIWRLGRASNSSLREDMHRRTENVEEEVDKLLGTDPPLHQESWHQVKGWYQAAVTHMPPPARVTLELITEDQVDLYLHVPPPEENIPVLVDPLPVEESVPTEDGIEWAAKQLQNHRSRGASRMQAEHLKGWLAEARKEAAAAEKV